MYAFACTWVLLQSLDASDSASGQSTDDSTSIMFVQVNVSILYIIL